MLEHRGRGDLLMGAWHDTPWMWLSMLVFWALLITCVYFAVRGAASSRPSRRGSGAAEILGQRLAHGEISPQEYRDRLEALDDRSEPPPRT